MQHDSVIWRVISPQNGGFCSFRRIIPGAPMRFCKNAYNVLGICSEMACPLSNSQYATIREKKGKCYLMIKTIERSHTPSKQWEKILLSSHYMTALKQIDEYLLWWPKWRINKCKLRLTKIHQFIIRSKRIALSVKPKLLRIWKPYERQQRNRERKAEIAAKISNVVKSELLERLHEGVYEGIYNFPQKTFQNVLKNKSKQIDDVDVDDVVAVDDNKEKQIKNKELSYENEFIGVIEKENENQNDYETDDDIEEYNNNNNNNKQYEYEYEYEYDNNVPIKQISNNNNSFNRRKAFNSKSKSSKSSVLGKRKHVHWKDQKNNFNKNKNKRKRQRLSVKYDD